MDGDFHCSGFVELHKEGLWGAVASSPAPGPELATHICQHLGCGMAVSREEQTPGTVGGHTAPERGSHLPVRWEVLEPCRSHSLLSCFNRTTSGRRTAPAFIICQGQTSSCHGPCSFPRPLSGPGAAIALAEVGEPLVGGK